MHLAVERGVPQEERKTIAAGLQDRDAACILFAARDSKPVRLGRTHMIFPASRKYLETDGAARSLEEMRRHRLVLQSADKAVAKEGSVRRVVPGHGNQTIGWLIEAFNPAKYPWFRGIHPAMGT
jgi:hypothetical protein